MNANQCGTIAGSSHALNSSPNSSANLIFSDDQRNIRGNIENAMEHTEEQTYSFEYSLQNSAECETQNNATGISIDNSSDNLIEIKSEVLLETSEASRVQLTDIIDAEYIEIDDDADDTIAICVGPKGFGAPFKMTTSCLIKRDDDLLSGNTPFNTNVSAQIYIGTNIVIVLFYSFFFMKFISVLFELILVLLQKNGRVYQVGSDKHEVPMNVINRFIQWNTSSLKANIFYDKMMVEALLLVLFSPEQMTEHCMNNDVRDFISSEY